MKIKEKRVSSFINTGNQYIAKGRTEKAINEVEKGLNYYTNNIINAIQPYANMDAGLIVLALRTVANQVENENEGAKELYEGFKEITYLPKLKQTEKIKKPNKKL